MAELQVERRRGRSRGVVGCGQAGHRADHGRRDGAAARLTSRCWPSSAPARCSDPRGRFRGEGECRGGLPLLRARHRHHRRPERRTGQLGIDRCSSRWSASRVRASPRSVRSSAQARLARGLGRSDRALHPEGRHRRGPADRARGVPRRRDAHRGCPHRGQQCRGGRGECRCSRPGAVGAPCAAARSR